MLDSTEWEKMEAGLKVAGGKCILNSTNYEDGPDERFFRVLGIGERVWCRGCRRDDHRRRRNGENGPEKISRLPSGRIDARHRVWNSGSRNFLRSLWSLPISTGIEEDRVNGKETIESIRLIRQNLTGLSHSVLGISNISFGLESGYPHRALNSMFLNDETVRCRH